MLVWLSILLWVDSALCLWFEDRIRRTFPRWPVRRLALTEAVVAAILLMWHMVNRLHAPG
ncbi:MAG TPA: hypothetical protein PKE26_03965 [Kiritimatiellia bacterium]|nr:hypothetical protein [Kiritimatiellia bacterium]HMO98245.1 hypothetical protein [Kiritimatiellia bacterium]HMP96590.1 hypothetical protein [Kiritimatiellia bacterium]